VVLSADVNIWYWFRGSVCSMIETCVRNVSQSSWCSRKSCHIFTVSIRLRSFWIHQWKDWGCLPTSRKASCAISWIASCAMLRLQCLTLTATVPARRQPRLQLKLPGMTRRLLQATPAFKTQADRPNLSEVDEYLQLKLGREPVQDVLQWWRAKTDKFPHLSILARQVFAIPASSAASERNFSSAGRVFDKRRTNLSSKTLDDILFLNSNFVE